MITINATHQTFCEALELKTRELAKTESVLVLYREAIDALEKIGFTGVEEHIRAESVEVKLRLGWALKQTRYSLPDATKLRVGRRAPNTDIFGRYGGEKSESIILSQPVAVRVVIEVLSRFGATVMVLEQGTIDIIVGLNHFHGLAAWIEIPYRQ